MHAALALALLLASLLRPGGAAAEPPPAGPAAVAPVAAPVTVPAAAAAEPAHRVMLWNRPVAELRAAVTGASAAERARRAEVRLAELPVEAAAAEVHAGPATLGGREVVALSLRDNFLFALYPEDVPAEPGLTLPAYGARVAAAVGEALRARGADQQLPALLRRLGEAAAATVAFALALLALARLRRAVLARLDPGGQLGWRRVVFGVDLAPLLAAVGHAAAKLAAVAAGLALTYGWLVFVLGRFPYTEPWASGLGAWLAGLGGDLAAGALGAVPGLVAVGIVVALARAVSRVASAFFARVETGRLKVAWLDQDTVGATRRIALGVIWLFALMVAYPYIPGSETGVFKGLSVLLGLMVTFGSSNLVNQLMSGLVLVYSRALRPGDFVKAGEVEGTVAHVGVLSTKVVNLALEEVTIPNAVLVAATVTNYSRLAGADGAVAPVKISIGYDAPWRQVHALLLAAARATPGLRAGTEPQVLQRALSDFYVEYQLLVHLDRPADRLKVLSDLHGAIQDQFNAAGVAILSPHFLDRPRDGRELAPPPHSGPAPT